MHTSSTLWAIFNLRYPYESTYMWLYLKYVCVRMCTYTSGYYCFIPSQEELVCKSFVWKCQNRPSGVSMIQRVRLKQLFSRNSPPNCKVFREDYCSLQIYTYRSSSSKRDNVWSASTICVCYNSLRCGRCSSPHQKLLMMMSYILQQSL